MAGSGWLSGGFVVLGGGLAVNSLLGPFVLDVVEYPLSETLLNQTIGLDAFSLIVVAPLCLVIAILLRRESVLGALIGVGVAGYAVYMLIQYIAGPAYLEHPRVMALQLPLLVVAGTLGLALWSGLDAARLSSTVAALPRAAARRRAWVLLGIGAFVVSRYIPAFAGIAAGDPLPDEAVDDPTMFWLIVMLDLGAVVPATVAASMGLMRGAVWASKALFAVVAWFVLVPPSVAAMAMAMLANDDPFASAAQAGVFVAAAAVFAVVAAWVYRPLLFPSSRAS